MPTHHSCGCEAIEDRITAICIKHMKLHDEARAIGDAAGYERGVREAAALFQGDHNAIQMIARSILALLAPKDAP